MKSLNELTKTEKGRLLADLFPDELRNLTHSILITCQFLKRREDVLQKNWVNEFTTLEFWNETLNDIEGVLKRHHYSIIRSSKVFSDQLFFGNVALLTIHCIINYAKRDNCEKKFQLAVQLLFD